MSGKTIRFGAGSQNSPRSSIWSITIAKSEVYIAQRFVYPLAKIILHSSGKCRFATNAQHWDKDKDRAIIKWERPDPVYKSVVLGPTIVIPPLAVDEPLMFSKHEKKEIMWLQPPSAEVERVFMPIFSLGESEVKYYLAKTELDYDWCMPLPIKNNANLNANTVTIVSWLQGMSESRRKTVDEDIQKLKIHHPKSVDTSQLHSTLTRFYPPSDEEKSRGLSPTIVEIILEGRIYTLKK